MVGTWIKRREKKTNGDKKTYAHWYAHNIWTWSSQNFLITTEIGKLEKLIKLELVVGGYKTKKL